MSGNSWIDDEWWRDSLFWAGAAISGVGVLLAIVLTDAPAWLSAIAGCGLFSIVVATLGFVRTSRRSYLGG